MFRPAIFAALALALTSAAACAPITTYSGFQAIDANPKDIKAGTDTKSTVRGKLGSPSTVSTFDNNIWYYIDQTKETISFKRPVTTRRDVVAIVFNKETEMVETVNQYSLKDGKIIAFNGRETPTRGRELSIMEQLVGSVGRGSGLLPNSDQDTPGNRPGDRR
jgi:outer membrane protein assembly factor BamE (lipoprotein component of BamABCDE complex)